MLFLESQVTPLIGALEARAPHCDAIVGCLSAPEVVRLTRLGKFDMSKPQSGPIALLKRLKGKSGHKPTSGAAQARLLRRLPKILKFIPGTAQDVRAYFLTMQYWLAGSEDNIRNMIAALIERYAQGPRAIYRTRVPAAAPIIYPDTGLYHPRMAARVSETISDLPHTPKRPTVGLLIMRSYILSGDTGHYDGMIAALEARGLNVIPAFASGLDSRPAIEAFFFDETGAARIDALVSLTGFSLVGGPAYNDASAASDILTRLDVPYTAAHALEFQTLDEWGANDHGLSPVEATMMVAIPELDGAANPMVYGGRIGGETCTGCARHCRFDVDARGFSAMRACPERAERLAARTEKMIRLRVRETDERRIAIVLFNFPPNGGATGTAAYLDVFASLHRLLMRLADDGYQVDAPATPEALRAQLLGGNAERYGCDANVHTQISADDHVRREARLAEIEQDA